MRNTVVHEIEQLANSDDSIRLITGDLGFGVLESFRENHRNKFLNLGICEQLIASVAAGMALEGDTVFVYSIGNFPTLRCIEQIRNDICYHKANVKIVAVGSGFVYGQLGMSHHATEDISVMRVMPHMQVFSPADPMEAVQVVRAAYEYEGPCYIRLGRGGEKNLHPALDSHDVYRALELGKGEALNILCSGSILEVGKEVADALNVQGISTGLYSFPTIKPIDSLLIRRLALSSKMIVTLEEHSVLGGFGGIVAEEIASLQGSRSRLMRVGLHDEFTSIVGDQHYLRDYYGMSARKILSSIKKTIQEEPV